MRALVVSNFYPPDAVGGYELVCEGVVDRLLADGDAVTVLTGRGIEVSGQPHVKRGLHRHLRPGSALSSQHPLRRLPAEISDHRLLSAHEKWDVALVFHMHGLSKSLLSALHRSGRPIAYILGDIWPGWDLMIDPWLGRLHPEGPPGTPREGIRRFRHISPLARMVAPAARIAGVPTRWPDLFAEGHWWANSQWTLDVLTERRGLPLANRKVIRHGIPLELFPQREAAELGRRLLCVGRITEAKGISVAIDAVRRMPGAELTLLGTPDPEFTGISDNQVRLRSPISRLKMAEVYARHDVFVFPVIWDEPLGMAPLEAMAVGVPVVATGTGGSAEYLAHEQNCLLVEPGDAVALAAAAERVLADESLRSKIVLGGLATARDFSFERTAKAILESARELNGSA